MNEQTVLKKECPKISIVIPAYNEENLDEKIIRNIQNFFSKKEISHEIIIVDDGSKNKIASNFAKVIRLEKNKGKGFAVKTGVSEAAGEYVLFMDADNSIDINHLDLAMARLEKTNSDIAIGSLYQKDSKEIQNPPLYRKVFGFISRQIIKLFLSLKIKDTQRGFKLFNRKSADFVFKRQRLSRWGFDFEILHIANKNGFKIVEFPVTFNNPIRKNISPMSYLKSFYELILVKIFDLKGFYNK